MSDTIFTRLISIGALCCTVSYQQQPVLWNAALFKPADQSTTFTIYVASWGNDGKHSFYTNPRNCQQTYSNNPAWWLVDLRGTFVIEQIVLTNLPDATSIRMKDFQIEVFETDPRDSPVFPNVTGKVCLNMSTSASNGTSTWNCTAPLVGRYVWNIMRHKQYLHAVEYKIMVSEVLRRVFSAYKKRTGQQIINPAALRNLTDVDSHLLCAMECRSLRETETCTAFNWFPLTQECQLFKVDARDVTSFQVMNSADVFSFTEIF